MIITIDGPAGSGKSTTSRRLADELGFHFLDTGAMYRAVAFMCVEEKINLTDLSAAERVATAIDIQFDGETVLVNGSDVTTAIRTPQVTQVASLVAAVPNVRRRMVELQRSAAAGLNVVSEGRDQGTVVFNDAEFKFFLTASLEARAERRLLEMESRGEAITFREVVDQMCERDRRDESRDIAPMIAAPDAVTIDTSNLTLEEVMQTMLKTIGDVSTESPSTTSAGQA